jgi:hypothetical protein
MDWKEWLDNFERNEFRPFKNHILPTYEITNENVTEAEYFNLINQPINDIINDKLNTQTSGSFRQDALFPTR